MIAQRVQTTGNNQWGDFPSENASWEIGKLVASIPRVSSSRLDLRCSKLDDVVRSFETVLNGKDIDTVQLLKACRAHLVLMQSGGSSLSLVARDLESNLQKVETLFKKSPKEGKTLSSLLEVERKKGLHNGNILRDPSAAIGLLWIRRSLAFQSDLYSSLILGDEKRRIRDVALDSYSKHLSPFHGWMLRTVFPASFSQMPERNTFIAIFGGIRTTELDEDYELRIVKKLRSLVAIWEPLIVAWKEIFERLGLEDTRRV